MLNKLYKGGEIQDAIERLNSNLKTKKNTVTSNEAREQKLEGDRIILEQIEELEERQSVIEKSLCWEKFKVRSFGIRIIVIWIRIFRSVS